MNLKVHQCLHQCRLAITLSVLAPLISPLPGEIEHGTVQITNSGGVIQRTLSTASSPGVGLNEAATVSGKFFPTFSTPTPVSNGLLMTSSAKLLYFGVPGTSMISVEGDQYAIPMRRPNRATIDPIDVDAAFALFPYSDWLAGRAYNAAGTNGGLIDALDANSAIVLGTHLFEQATPGVFRFESGQLNARSSQGILLVNGGKDENNYAMSQADLSGNPPRDDFNIFVHDNGVQGAAYERDPFTFLYIPTGHNNPQIPAMGRIRGDGEIMVGAGSYSVSKVASGVWRLRIPGHSSATGTLIISAEGGESNNVDNIVSYEPDGRGGWLIESRDLSDDAFGDPQELGLEAAFSFAFVTTTPTDVLFVSQGAQDGGDGSSWAAAFQDLQSALAVATPGSEIWITGGTYYPDEGAGQTDNNRNASFNIPDNVSLYGGFGGWELAREERRLDLFTTTLSGDLAQNDLQGIETDNAYHIVQMTSGGSGALIDGFTISGGRANGLGDWEGRGGGLISANQSGIMISNCYFENNLSTRRGGGGVHIGNEGQVTFQNCGFQGNRAEFGGGISFDEGSAGSVINCSFQGNHAGNAGGGIYHLASSLNLVNTVAWGNTQGNTLSQINRNVAALSTSITYAGCLIGGRSQSTNGNLDGTDPSNNPLFIREVDPAISPSTGGILKVSNGSPLIDQGISSTTARPIDLLGRSRFIGTSIDIGAVEHHPVIFVDRSNSGTQNGTSWDDAYSNLHLALASADDGTDLWIRSGTFTPSGNEGETTFAVPTGVSLFGGFSGSENDPSERPRSPSSFEITSLSGRSGANSYQALTTERLDRTTLIDRISVRSSNSGFQMQNSSPTFKDCLFTNNSANFSPVFTSTRSNQMFLNCQFIENFATSFSGVGSIFGGRPVFAACSFKGNLSRNAIGAISVNSTAAHFTNCVFSGNFAENRGGALGLGGNTGTFIAEEQLRSTFDHCSFSGNNAGTAGGAISTTGPEAFFRNCIFWNNGVAGDPLAPGATFSRSGNSALSRSPRFISSLVQGDTNSLNADPLFVYPIHPADAPTALGSLRLRSESPAIDAGENGAYSSAQDILGFARSFDRTGQGNANPDLGAYEKPAPYYVNLNAPAGGDGRAWASSFDDLATALATLRNNPTATDELWIAAGIYYPTDDGDRAASFHLIDDLSLIGGFSGSETSPSQRVSTSVTTLSGDIGTVGDSSDNSYHVVYSNSGSPALLDGLTISAGQADGEGGNGPDGSFDLQYRGGGLYGTVHGPWVERCIFIGNHAGSGGAVSMRDSSPAFESCLFLDNSCLGNGGAVYLSNGTGSFGNCTFTGNTSSRGGGLFAGGGRTGSLIRISNCIFWGNTASNRTLRPSLSIRRSNAESKVTISNSIVEGSGGSAGWDPQTGEDGGNNLDADPLFESSSTPIPSSGSPAVDSGSNDAVRGTRDLRLTPRINGNAVDRGSYER